MEWECYYDDEDSAHYSLYVDSISFSLVREGKEDYTLNIDSGGEETILAKFKAYNAKFAFSYVFNELEEIFNSVVSQVQSACFNTYSKL
jgi:hypothetical protein